MLSRHGRRKCRKPISVSSLKTKLDVGKRWPQLRYVNLELATLAVPLKVPKRKKGFIQLNSILKYNFLSTKPLEGPINTSFRQAINLQQINHQSSKHEKGQKKFKNIKIGCGFAWMTRMIKHEIDKRNQLSKIFAESQSNLS